MITKDRLQDIFHAKTEAVMVDGMPVIVLHHKSFEDVYDLLVHEMLDTNCISTREGDKESCGICGSAKVLIRGKYPKQPKRLICPTCAYERLEQINQISGSGYLTAATISPDKTR